ncbi:hypothetical protein [Clostridium saccharoperbutylacetonicum]|uniref:hypothetical protein n=1 Tax=Clostridium saccharoperbutylacetonicum TaxID=36745 RepID=UPI0039E7B483
MEHGFEITQNNSFKDGIYLKNIDLAGISELQQLRKIKEEEKELSEAYAEYQINPTIENKLHVIEEWWDKNQAELGLLEKEGITAKEVQAYYPTHLIKMLSRPREKKCSKCEQVNILGTYTEGNKIMFCPKRNKRVNEELAKKCKNYKEQEE